ncbi:YhcN/YlaJ family sporulation lipoprotein [Bacillus sp. 03113]|uniref:YhcN/YlaJ family sporulation lipoprotein n=1 Tax=Bacillus sp. 03113 TaxID=2578211 RepID=UPI0011422C59|nr:YhcN/YlaJ family sporulation lipoprotein [Bacillus sp. 03113]
MKTIFVLTSVLMIITGCVANNKATEPKKENLITVKNSSIQEVDRETGQKISKHLVNLATSIPNVNDATAVVLGKFAIVGIDVDRNIDRSEVGSIKYSVAESLKKDPHGARAVVIADPDVNARLKEISEDIQNGKPIQGIVNELSDITGRLMPEIPADMIDPKPKNAVEKPKNKLEGSEKQSLEEKQEKQSNHYKD